MAEALAVALVLVAVITFAFHASGSGHSPARAQGPPTTIQVAPTSTTVSPTTTSLPVSNQVAEWWTATGGPATSQLTADLGSIQGDASNQAKLANDCTSFGADAVATASAAPAPEPAIQREWQLTLSTTHRVAVACAGQEYQRVATDVEPALYTIRDLAHQVSPYLAGRAP